MHSSLAIAIIYDGIEFNNPPIPINKKAKT